MSAGSGRAEWDSLQIPWRRSLELAWDALVAGGLAVGAVVTDADDEIVAAGRNRAYDPPGGPEPLQGTPLAHAEMNALAQVRTEAALGGCTLWSTVEPCAMCAAAALFTGVGRVRYLAPDPWAVAAGVRSTADTRTDEPVGGPVGVVASVLFLASIARSQGLSHAIVTRNRELQPLTYAMVAELASGEGARDGSPPASLAAFVATRWHRIVAAVTVP